jgi:hypothetical protein
MWIIYVIAIVAFAIIAANTRIKFAWVVLLLAALMALRITQPVTYVVGEPGTNYLGHTRTDN